MLPGESCIDLDSKVKLLSMPIGIPFVSSSRKLSLDESKRVRGFIAAFEYCSVFVAVE